MHVIHVPGTSTRHCWMQHDTYGQGLTIISRPKHRLVLKVGFDHHLLQWQWAACVSASARSCQVLP
jgi:hypothetical protein